MFSLISVWTNGWVNNRETGDAIEPIITVMHLIPSDAELWWCLAIWCFQTARNDLFPQKGVYVTRWRPIADFNEVIKFVERNVYKNLPLNCDVMQFSDVIQSNARQQAKQNIDLSVLS